MKRLERSGRVVLLALALIPAAALDARALDYTVTDLGSLGGERGSGAYALNGVGVSAGYSFVAGPALVHAMINDHGVVKDLGTLGGTQSLARAVNASGSIVGWAYVSGSTTQHAFLWRDGAMVDLGAFGGSFADAHDLNDAELIVGSASHPNGAQHAFWWQNGQMHDLGTFGGNLSRAFAVNAWGDIVGASMLAGDNDLHPFLTKPGSPLYDLGTLGGPAAQAYDVNDLVHVCGWSEISVSSPESRAFFWADGLLKMLPTLGGGFGAAYSINNHDEVVGASTREDGAQAACLWVGNEVIDLETTLEAGSGWRLLAAWAIDDGHAIVGEGISPSGAARAFLLTPVGSLSVDGDPVAGQAIAMSISPNPALDRAHLVLQMPAAGPVHVTVYDAAGRRVKVLFAGRMEAGRHGMDWDVRTEGGDRASVGIYWIALESGSARAVRPLVVAR